MTAVVLLAAVLALGAVFWLSRTVPFTRRGVARRLARPQFWEQALAGREQAELTVFGPVADDVAEAAPRLGYDVGEPTTDGGRTRITVRRRLS